MEDGGVLEAMTVLTTEDLMPREHIEKGWVLNSTGQYHKKGDKDNNVSEFKYRWVVDGSAAIKGVHYAQNSSPTPKPESMRIICAEAPLQCSRGTRTQGDMPSACTHWDQPKECPYYMRMPSFMKVIRSGQLKSRRVVIKLLMCLKLECVVLRFRVC